MGGACSAWCSNCREPLRPVQLLTTCTDLPPLQPPQPPSPPPPSPPPLSMHCNGSWPAAFDSARDLISLHYDCSADPDDFESAVADRAVLERTFGTVWLFSHVVPVAGTFGTNTDYQQSGVQILSILAHAAHFASVCSRVRRDASSHLGRHQRLPACLHSGAGPHGWASRCCGSLGCGTVGVDDRRWRAGIRQGRGPK